MKALQRDQAREQRDQARETYLQERNNYVNGLEKDLTSYKAQAEDLQRAHKNSSARLARFEEERQLEVDRVTQASLENGKALRLKEGLELGSMVGAHRCRSYVLMTPHGQAFIDALVKGLPEAYLNFPDFWERIEEPLTDWIAAIVHNCCVQS